MINVFSDSDKLITTKIPPEITKKLLPIDIEMSKQCEEIIFK
jgi:hypothetical protein